MGLFSSGSAKRAAAVQARFKREASEMLGETKEEALGYYAPYVQAGTQSLDDYTRLAGELEAPTDELYDLSTQMDPILQSILNPSMEDVKQTPGYDFRMAEGEKALSRSAAARGNSISGAASKDLLRYGQDYATSEHDNYLNRLYSQLGAVGTQMGGRQDALNARYQNMNAYTPVMNTGFNAAGASANTAYNIGSQQANLHSGQGDDYASGMIANSNQLLGLGEGLLSLAGSLPQQLAGTQMGVPMGGGASPISSAPIGGGTGSVGGTSSFNPLQGATDFIQGAAQTSASSYG